MVIFFTWIEFSGVWKSFKYFSVMMSKESENNEEIGVAKIYTSTDEMKNEKERILEKKGNE